MLCHFDRLLNGPQSLISFISAALFATNEYVTVPERFAQNEEPASRNEEGSKNKPSSAPTLHLNEAQAQ